MKHNVAQMHPQCIHMYPPKKNNVAQSFWTHLIWKTDPHPLAFDHAHTHTHVQVCPEGGAPPFRG